MKLAIILLFISTLSFGQGGVIYPIGIYKRTHQLVRYECEICGTSIWQCEKIPELPYDDNRITSGLYGRNWDCHDNWSPAVKGEIVLSVGKVCQKCYDEYVKPIGYDLGNLFKINIDEVKKTNANQRIANDKKRKDQEIKGLTDKIEKIQEEIDRIKSGKPKQSKSLWLGGIKCDSLMRGIKTDSTKILKISREKSIIIKPVK